MITEGQVRRSGKSEAAFRTISEVADDLEVPQHVLRFWESKFSQVKPLKRGGGRRYYRPEDVVLLRHIRHLLYSEGYTIKGVQKLLREGGHKQSVGTSVVSPDGDTLPPALLEEVDFDDGDGVLEDDEEESFLSSEPDRESLTPEVRTEIETIISELEQLRDLLQAK